MRKVLCLMSVLYMSLFASTQQAHVHGEVELEVAFIDKVLVIDLHSPLMNIANFEYEPKTKEEKDILKKKLSILEKMDFNLNKKALCEKVSTNIEDIFEEEHHSKEHEDEEHFEAKANYIYNCKKPNLLEQIDTAKVFNDFPAIHKIHSALVTNKKQSSSVLNHKNTILNLK